MAGVGFYFLKDLSPGWMILLAKFSFLIAGCLYLIGNIYIMIVMRILQGFVVGLTSIYNAPCIYQMAYPTHRPAFISISGVFFSLGIFVSYGLRILDSGGRVVWRVYYGL